jgi:hypothetical protein
LSATAIVRVECMACQLIDQAELDLHLPNLETLVVRQDVTWGDRRASVCVFLLCIVPSNLLTLGRISSASHWAC